MIGKLNYNLLQKIHDKGSNPVLNTKEKENNGWIRISSIVYHTVQDYKKSSMKLSHLNSIICHQYALK